MGQLRVNVKVGVTSVAFQYRSKVLPVVFLLILQSTSF